MWNLCLLENLAKTQKLMERKTGKFGMVTEKYFLVKNKSWITFLHINFFSGGRIIILVTNFFFQFKIELFY